MKETRKHKIFFIILYAVVFIAAWVSLSIRLNDIRRHSRENAIPTPTSTPIVIKSNVEKMSLAIVAEPTIEFRNFLPLILKPKRTKLIGANITSYPASTVEQYVNSGYIRVFLDWNYAEKTMGVYDFSYYLSHVTKNNPVVISIRNSPSWASQSEWTCAPPLKPYWDNFIELAVKAVKATPNAIAVELWNEPNVSQDLVAKDWIHYGCWGNNYIDGAAYGRFVNYVAPRIKNRVNVKIIAGAFMTNARQENYPFLDGFFKSVIKDNIDILSYHFYAYEIGDFADVLYFSDILRGKFNKQIWLTETAFLCVSNCEDQQAAFMYHLLRILDGGYLGQIFWHELPPNSWGDCALIKPYGPSEAYYIYAEKEMP